MRLLFMILAGISTNAFATQSKIYHISCDFNGIGLEGTLKGDMLKIKDVVGESGEELNENPVKGARLKPSGMEFDLSTMDSAGDAGYDYTLTLPNKIVRGDNDAKIAIVEYGEAGGSRPRTHKGTCTLR